MSKPIHLKKYVRENGTIEDAFVETHLGLITDIQYDIEDSFIRMKIDTGDATDIETRLTIEDLEKLLNEYHEIK